MLGAPRGVPWQEDYSQRQTGRCELKQPMRSRKSKRLRAAAICVAVIAIAAAGFAGCGSDEPEATASPAPRVGEAPTPTNTLTPTPSPGDPSPTDVPVRHCTLTITISPSGAGTVTNPGSSLAAGTEAVLTAFPSTGYAFDYWAGDTSGTSISTVVTMLSNRSVTAHFVPNTVRSIQVTPTTASIETRRTTLFKAVATYSDGTTADLTNSVTWGSSSPSVATVAPGGQAMGISAGRVIVRATLGPVRGWASLTVTPC